MEKKKVFFLVFSLNVGGVEKSLINLLSFLPAECYDIHVGLVWPEGKLMDLLQPNIKVNVIYDLSERWKELNDPPLKTIKKYFFSCCFLKAMIAFWIYLKCKLSGSFFWWTDYVLANSNGILEMFDLAIAYAGPATDIDYYICKKVQAKKKIGWVHFDISKFGIDKKTINQLYKQYERIFVVSETGKALFDQVFPQFKRKAEVFHNIVSPILVKKSAATGETFRDCFNGKRILTVGRISPEKGQLFAIYALRILVDKGYNIRWYFIGEGSDMIYCKNVAERLRLSEYVVFLGTKMNPYAFMRDCDIYMQPSRHEGFCITLAEALCFGNPIVATDFTGAREQLVDRENGFVVGMDAEAIASGIEKALSASKTTKVMDIENSDVEKLLSLL